jgi:hypothetical protein
MHEPRRLDWRRGFLVSAAGSAIHFVSKPGLTVMDSDALALPLAPAFAYGRLCVSSASSTFGWNCLSVVIA